MLHINAITYDAVQQFEKMLHQGEVSSIISLLFREKELRETQFEKMIFYRVRKEWVTPIEMYPDLRKICDFVNATSWPDRRISLQVSGWSLDKLDQPNELLLMLLSQYSELELVVSPSTRRIHTIRSI